MISICIPVYNFNVSALVIELSRQALLLKQPSEIILIDDASDQKFKEVNRPICEKNIYVELSENIGRARIRNLFLKYAKYPYLLFIDCDSLLESPDYLHKYMEVIQENPMVVCGGRAYPKIPPGRDKRLRWKYGAKRESHPVNERRANPYQSFMTNNFLINKEVLDKIKFDERLSTYGHEDTLFGYALKKQNISILHIDNPVMNGDLETNQEYLRKTKEGVINLLAILKYTGYDKELIDDISLLRFYYKIKGFDFLFIGLFKVGKPVILFLLERGFVNLSLFDFYKLGVLIENIRRNKL